MKKFPILDDTSKDIFMTAKTSKDIFMTAKWANVHWTYFFNLVAQSAASKLFSSNTTCT